METVGAARFGIGEALESLVSTESFGTEDRAEIVRAEPLASFAAALQGSGSILGAGQVAAALADRPEVAAWSDWTSADADVGLVTKAVDLGALLSSDCASCGGACGGHSVDASGSSSTDPNTGPASPEQMARYLTTTYWNQKGEIPHHWQDKTLSVNLTGVTSDMKMMIRAALEAWESVTGLKFNEKAGTADIMFDMEGTGARTTAVYQTNGVMVSANVSVPKSWLEANGKTLGSYSMQTFIHEIGHALGLGHPGGYGIVGGTVYKNDSWQMSVMSYNSQSENRYVTASAAVALTPMMADIIAMQSFYGKPQGAATAGNTVYGKGSNLGTYLDDVFAGKNASMASNAITIFDEGGVDRIDFSNDTKAQRVNLNSGSWSDVYGKVGNLGIAKGTTIEHYVAGSGDDTVTGNAAANNIRGMGGNDRIKGQNGNDTLLGGGGSDLLWGDNGNDSLSGDDGNDQIHGGAGNDRQQGGNGNDSIWGEAGNDQLRGNGGNDKVWAGDGSDTLYGDNGDDSLSGQNGNDRIYGGNNVDNVLGGLGDDRIWGGSGGDTLKGEGGNDTIWGDAGNDRLFGGDGVDRIDGGADGDTLWGGNGNDVLIGSGGDDNLYGDFGDDTLQGGDGRDYLRGDGNHDVLQGGNGDDTLLGGDGNDRLYGEGNNDTLMGDAGNDILAGGVGNDAMTGGAGADVFVFNGGRDRITDFQNDVDTIQIDDAMFGGRSLTVSQVLDYARVVGGDIVFDFQNGSTLTVTGVTSVEALANDLAIV